ncbi:lipoprotein [Streptomyces eurocidicus]|uniref:Lipoprotein n=1 Tax=Streptomyces eurocidicus TaxID=66423 RepID=A0A2N8NTA1_STREU|nr:hypothetical protein [Streptomyces eurocidicus]MBB5120937.1 hypothetical protein [Streptomyces eurocidicus]MBF6055663.1 hypothetical protein [Streptomyces eurocidicus]PNE32006.1 lipoprotein [Streptomyces eurocidicus]
MRIPSRTIALPALTAASLLVVGCSAAGPATTASGGGAEPAATTPPPAAERQLAVKAAIPEGSGTPSAVAHPSGGGRQAEKSSLKVASYDRKSGRAVISGAAKPARKPSAAHPAAPSAPAGPASPSASAGGPGRNSSVAVGDIIASAPTPGAPDGVLAKVTQVLGSTDKGTEVNTTPATLGALLGDAKADGKVPVDPSAVTVEPLVQGTKVSWAKTGDVRFGPKGGKVPLGSLRIDVGTSIATAKGAPVSAAASASGFVQLAPEVDFSYDGRGGSGLSPGSASLALAGDWTSGWELKGQAAATTDAKPLRMPFAKLKATPVIQVGAVPVVVNVGLTCYLQVDADGHVNVDIKQDLKGGFRVGGDYTHAKGWTPVNTSDITATSPRATVSAAGKVKATLGTEASLGLYGTVGVTADVAPYLRAEAEGEASAAMDGSASAAGKWKAFGGLDLSGALQVQLKIFNTPIFEKPVPLGALHREWKIAEGAGAVSTGARRR